MKSYLILPHKPQHVSILLLHSGGLTLLYLISYDMVPDTRTMTVVWVILESQPGTTLGLMIFVVRIFTRLFAGCDVCSEEKKLKVFPSLSMAGPSFPTSRRYAT